MSAPADPFDNAFARAMAEVRAQHTPREWEVMAPSERTAAIYHEMCRIDSRCPRTGTAADAGLPPCPASDTFIANRRCRLAGPRRPVRMP
jgi:hypothetical protein